MGDVRSLRVIPNCLKSVCSIVLTRRLRFVFQMSVAPFVDVDTKIGLDKLNLERFGSKMTYGRDARCIQLS